MDIRLSASLSGVLALLMAVVCGGTGYGQEGLAESGPELQRYRIRIGDKLSVRFPYQPEYSLEAVQVRPDGSIGLLQIGDLPAAGQTVRELQSTIEKAYADHLREPAVTVNITEFVPPRVYIGGQVGKPGSYDLRSGRTLIQMIFLAGGFTGMANRKTVLHARPKGNGEMVYTNCNVLAMLSKPTKEDMALQDGDYIYVPDSKLSKGTRVIDVFRSFIPSFGIGLRY